jgi:dipeptidase D
MENILKDLKPNDVFKYFFELTQIPRGSGNEEAVSNYLVDFAKKHNLSYIQEECNNVIIKKKATKGYENSKKVILQGHMDIVCAKNDGYKFDFEKDSIELIIDGDYIKTKGTTLGADNGIALAMTMAILADDTISHPEISALFTISEETGMDGAILLKSENINGDILINIDSEEEGTILSSCAGGVNSNIYLNYEKINNKKDSFEISINGLVGGHSGIEINKNRANAVKLMGRLLKNIDSKMKFNLSEISGGEKMNAIPKRCKSIISIDKNEIKILENVLNEMQTIFSSEFEISDPEIKIYIKKIENREFSMDNDSKGKVISLILLIPQGVETMSAKMVGLVESSNNLGVIETKENEVVIINAIRSSVKSLKDEIIDRIREISNLVDAKNELEADYPEWEYKIESPIRDLMIERYKTLYDKELKVDAIHAGLECGLLKEKVGDIDMISLGPNIYDVHTPDEHLSISSTERVYKFLCEVLKEIK